MLQFIASVGSSYSHIWHFAVPAVAASVASPSTCTVSKNRTDVRPPGTVGENTVTGTRSTGTRRSRKTAASDSEDE